MLDFVARCRFLLLASLVLMSSAFAQAQSVAGPSSEQASPEARADALLAPPPEAEAEASVPILDLFLKGGWLMAPIVVLSLIVVAVGVERWFGLRRSRVVPRALVQRLYEQINLDAVDPRSAFALCNRYPSSAARVVKALLAKTGRPHAEIESAAAEATNREADGLYSNVRTLNLAATVAPLMGLLGTVWGMIESFFATANLPLGSNKGQALAEGIYVALVTTFAGLAVAIPAAVLAHYFEGRILRLMRRIEKLTSDLLPTLERYEGQRIDPQILKSAGDGSILPTSEASIDETQALDALART